MVLDGHVKDILAIDFSPNGYGFRSARRRISYSRD